MSDRETIERLVELEKKATGPPWMNAGHAEIFTRGEPVPCKSDPARPAWKMNVVCFVNTEIDRCRVTTTDETPIWWRDMEFIIALRNASPWLLPLALRALDAESERLRTEVAGYKQVVEKSWSLARDFIASRVDEDESIAVDIDFLVGRMLREISVLESVAESNRKCNDDMEKAMLSSQSALAALAAELAAMRESLGVISAIGSGLMPDNATWKDLANECINTARAALESKGADDAK